MAPVTRLAEAIRGDDDRWCLLIVIGLALTFTVMHYNFIETPAQTVQGIKNVTLVTRAQIDLAQGKMRQSAHLQQRILVPNIFYVISFVSPWPPVTRLAEAIRGD
ncbi:MAG: hypothetical protein HY660_09500, partial [Armatimonadetes bacterium]|nr:hypothetical protein [Armatimonadota bacterium]